MEHVALQNLILPYSPRLLHWPWGNLMIQGYITGAILWFRVTSLGQSYDSGLHHWGNLMIQGYFTGAILWFRVTSLGQSYDSGLHHWHWGNLMIQGYITGAILLFKVTSLGQSYYSRLHHWHWGNLMIQCCIAGTGTILWFKVASLALGQSYDSRLHRWPWGNLMIQDCITGPGAILWLPQCQWCNLEKYEWNRPAAYHHNKTFTCEYFLGCIHFSHYNTIFSKIFYHKIGHNRDSSDQWCWWKQVGLSVYMFKSCFCNSAAVKYFHLILRYLVLKSSSLCQLFSSNHRSITSKFVTPTAPLCIDNSWRSTTLPAADSASSNHTLLFQNEHEWVSVKLR